MDQEALKILDKRLETGEITIEERKMLLETMTSSKSDAAPPEESSKRTSASVWSKSKFSLLGILIVAYFITLVATRLAVWANVGLAVFTVAALLFAALCGRALFLFLIKRHRR